MKILTNGERVDFEAPIQMDENQFNSFIDFIKELLKEDIEVKDIPEKHKDMKDIQRGQKKWTTQELFLLLGSMGNKELSKKLDRSDMSIVMKRGHFVPGFMSWAREKEYESSNITETIIKQFLEEEKNDNS